MSDRFDMRAAVLCESVARAAPSHAAIVAGFEAVRAEALEEAARACEALRSSATWSGRGAGNVAWDNARHVCAEAIRKLGRS